jgi:hypothetical protein
VDLPVLKYLDVLIGLSLVMLLAATVALTISQALLNLWSSRARHLAWAIERLVHQIHPAILGPHAGEMSWLILQHPLVCLPRNPVGRAISWLKRKLRDALPVSARPYVSVVPRAHARVVLREELVLCLLEWATPDGAWSMGFDAESSVDAAGQRRVALTRALRARGIEDPAATLKAVKLQAMANERDHPDQSAEVWRSRALAQCAPSEFLATVYAAFDNAMARATTTFGREAQTWVSLVALGLVLVVQLDAVQLVRRLSIDDAYRTKLVEHAEKMTTAIDAACPALPAAPAGGPPPGAPAAASPDCDPTNPADVARVVGTLQGSNCEQPALPAVEREKCRIQASLASLRSPALDLWPEAGAAGATVPWAPTRYPAVNAWATQVWPKLPGILLSWLLVSLGAPFWYDLLKNLFKLRSLLAQKDDADRTERNAGVKPTATVTVTGPAAGSAAPAPASPPEAQPDTAVSGTVVADLAGEMGDLAATGAQG